MSAAVEAGARVTGAQRELLRRQYRTRARRMRPFYLLLLISFAFLFLFKYVPIYGMAIAFTDFNVQRGLLGSEWNDFAYFKRLMRDPFFSRVLFNTVYLSFLRILFQFPAPIIFALLLNEIRFTPFKRAVQSFSYFPHFISWVLLAGIISQIVNTYGPVFWFFGQIGAEPVHLLTHVPTFRGLLVVTGIWQSVGWGSIIYLAALSGIDPQLYESAQLDGAGRLRQALSISLPSLVPMIFILFLMQVAALMQESWEQIFNLYEPPLYQVADVFETLIYRAGIQDGRFGYTTAIGLFQNVAGLIILLIFNAFIRRSADYGAYALW